jgi:hypothetical protein
MRKAEIYNAPEIVRVSMKVDVFAFTLESNGSLRPEEIVLKSFKVLLDKLEMVEEKVLKIKENAY